MANLGPTSSSGWTAVLVPCATACCGQPALAHDGRAYLRVDADDLFLALRLPFRAVCGRAPTVGSPLIRTGYVCIRRPVVLGWIVTAVNQVADVPLELLPAHTDTGYQGRAIVRHPAAQGCLRRISSNE